MKASPICLARCAAMMLMLLLAACGPLPLDPLPGPFALAETTPTPTPDGDAPCAWQWGRQSLPDLSAALETALRENVLPDASAYAEAYGENCIAASGAVSRFAAMQTDFYITLPVPSLDDQAALGALLESTLSTVEQFPAGQTPGPLPGYVGITFQSPSEEIRLWITPARLAEVRAKGLSGAALFEALQKP